MAELNRRIKVLYLFTSCKKSGPIQQMRNLIGNMDPKIFEVRLFTIYPEDEKLSVLNEYISVLPHRFVSVNKFEALFGTCSNLRKAIDEFEPDVIHSLGVFPDYLIERLGKWKHTFTCRNYIYDDYLDEYGRFVGTLLANIHLKAIKQCPYVRVCSESLSRIYKEKLNIDIPFIRNGVDVSQYSVPTSEEKRLLREKLGIPSDKTVWVYGGVFNGRKNHAFLLDAVRDCRHFNDSVIVLPGDGELFETLKQKYGSFENVIMPGNVRNMNEYLAASDIYLSTSKSEGMPNGVLEAMATGLPVLLSDIDQHKELVDASDNTIGYLYQRDNRKSFVENFDKLYEEMQDSMSKAAVSVANERFSAQVMSSNYQALYHDICKR